MSNVFNDVIAQPFTTVGYDYNVGETKEQILERLFKANLITFVELMVLLDVRENSFQGPTFTTTHTGANVPINNELKTNETY